jgi:hypothetical protein
MLLFTLAEILLLSDCSAVAGLQNRILAMSACSFLVGNESKVCDDSLVHSLQVAGGVGRRKKHQLHIAEGIWVLVGGAVVNEQNRRCVLAPSCIC